MKILLTIIVSIFSLINIISCQDIVRSDCGTAIDCYARAIDLVNKARKELYDARDKFDQAISVLQKYTDNQFNLDRNRISQLEEKSENLNSKVDGNFNVMSSRVDNLDRRLHNHNCREISTSCTEDGGGNMVFLDRQNVSCGANEYIRNFDLRRCDNNHGILFHFTCCSFP